jgi:3-hydroxyacyl-CoA dehydrogenase
MTGTFSRTVQRVGVLGAGTMGARIAAHFANAGIPSLLLDLDAALARQGIENALKQRPAGFFSNAGAALVMPGSFDHHLDQLSACDWIIEAVVENLDTKRALWNRVLPAARADAILSTNTSGIPLRDISAAFPAEARPRFLGTHFFNPPRYLHLLEVIPGAETDAALLSWISRFAASRLGKGVVLCKDTPNFIANRIGLFWGATAIRIALHEQYTVEETDAITGALIGLPNSATFRLLDIIGLDTAAFVGENLYHAALDDPWRDRFLTPEIQRRMIERKWLGEKSGQGFYKRVGAEKAIHAIAIHPSDVHHMEYHPAAKISFPSADAARSIEDLGQRLRTLLAGQDRVGLFLWKLYRDVFLYSAGRVPEISDRIVEIDRAMRWGFAHQLGPFELWDALGFAEVCARIEKDGHALPDNVAAMRGAGVSSFYQREEREYFDLGGSGYQPLEAPGLILAHCHTVKRNAGASLRDLGDGVLCVEVHSKLNVLGLDQIQMIQAGLEETENHFEAMVVANQGSDFSAGANLLLILLAAREDDWDEIGRMVARFQQMNQAMKYARKPVVAAPFGRTLGGGCEIALHAHRMQAGAETYMGLVEVGVGVIPAGGGCKEMLARVVDPHGDTRKLFETIGGAKVSSCAEDARTLGFLAAADRMSMNPDRLIDDAKQLALELSKDYTPRQPSQIKVGGEAAYALMKLGAWTYHQGGYITDYDLAVAEKLAHVLSGGRLTGEQTVSEQYLLDLEREAFLSLCGNSKTLARMEHTLKTGKPLRN